MRRTPAWMVAALGLAAVIGWAAPARAGVWVTLAAGLPGATSPSSESEFWFDSPHAPPLVAVNELTGGAQVEAATAGGSVFFGGSGTPVLLNLADGSAYLASGGPPDAAKTRGPGGAGAGTPASAAPTTGGPVPSEAALLGLALAEPDADGVRQLTATATDPAGNVLGAGNLSIPTDGWWVIGLGSNTTTGPGPTDPGPVDPIPTDPEPTDPGPTDPGPVDPVPGEPDPGTGGPVATPEPTSVALVTIGGVAAAAWRRVRGREKTA